MRLMSVDGYCEAIISSLEGRVIWTNQQAGMDCIDQSESWISVHRTQMFY